MAGKITSEAARDAAEMNMTPMIDCVFQLLIFFMVCTQIKQSDDAEVQLPRTRFTETDPAPKNRVVINCTWNTESTPGGAAIHDELQVRNRSFDGPTLQAYLEKIDREDRLQNGRPLRTGADAASASDLFVKIRADARCEWRTVQAAQMACTQAGIFKVSYGTEPAERLR